VIVRNGVVVPGAPSVNVATVDFLARGGDQYPFRGLPFTNLGLFQQQSLDAYITSPLGGVITAREYRAGGEGRINRVVPPSLADVLRNFGTAYSPHHIVRLGDLDGNGVVDIADLSTAITQVSSRSKGR
jgi:hypothetical protein